MRANLDMTFGLLFSGLIGEMALHLLVSSLNASEHHVLESLREGRYRSNLSQRRGMAVACCVFLVYALHVIESHSPCAFLGLALSISGVIGLGYMLVERLITSEVFSVFLRLTPIFLSSQFRYEPAIAWFRVRSSRNLYDCWDTSLIYLFLLSLILAMVVGFWVFIVLRILGVYDIGISALIIWFAMLCVVNFVAAVSQHAIEVKAQHKRATSEEVKEDMAAAPVNTLKRTAHHFLRNWVGTPLTTLKLLAITVLFILLHWPAWLLKGVNILKTNLNDKKAREHYYIAYGVLASVAGVLLIFFFK